MEETMSKPRKPHWVDCLHTKHECWGYEETRTLELSHENRTIHLLVPDDLPLIDVRIVGQGDALLFLMGETEEVFAQRKMGVFLVAKRKEADVYEVGVWHELYPYALSYFGLNALDF